MVTDTLRDTINAAIEQDRLTGELREHFQRALPGLQRTLVLQDEDPVGALTLFVTRYIRSVPVCLRLATAVSHRQGFFDYAAPFLHLAEDYFLHPPDAVAKDLGLLGLLDEAFLAHRLFEEVNDHHIRHLQRSLFPVDMTEANIIVHHLVGDELACRLEELVQFTAAGLLGKEHVWLDVREQAGSAAQQKQVSSENLGLEGQGVRLRLRR